MKKGTKLLAVGVVTLALSSPALAMQSAEELKGKEIRNQQGEDIGTIEEVLINKQGEIDAVVVEEGGFFGIGGEDRRVEWSSLSQSPDRDYLIYSETAGTQQDIVAKPAQMNDSIKRAGEEIELDDNKEANNLATRNDQPSGKQSDQLASQEDQQQPGSQKDQVAGIEDDQQSGKQGDQLASQEDQQQPGSQKDQVAGIEEDQQSGKQGDQLTSQEDQQQPGSQKDQVAGIEDDQQSGKQGDQVAAQEDRSSLNQQDKGKLAGISTDQSSEEQGKIEAGLAATLLGNEITGKNGETLGTVEQFVFSDMQSDSVKYLLIQGENDTYHPLPVELVRVKQDGEQVRLQARVDRKTFAQAPAIKRGEIMQLSQKQQTQEIESYYGISPAWKENDQQSSSEQSSMKKSDKQQGGAGDQQSQTQTKDDQKTDQKKQ